MENISKTKRDKKTLLLLGIGLVLLSLILKPVIEDFTEGFIDGWGETRMKTTSQSE